MENDYQKCIGKCDRGTFCSGYDCFKAGYNSGFKEREAFLKEIDKMQQVVKELKKQTEELMMDVLDKLR
jgi:hypothetical protein